MDGSDSQAGGFLPVSLPSPPPSTVASLLPTPRSHPLKPGSHKETEFVNYVDSKLLDISGKYERRNQANGYQAFSEAAKDLESVTDVAWVSGTPNLQIPFLLSIVLAATTYVPSFPFSPKHTFQLFNKLDLAFSSLLNGAKIESGEQLPGFSTGRKVTMTEKIRLRGMVERARVNVARVSTQESVLDEGSRITEATTEDEDEELIDDNGDDNYGSWEMDVARLFSRTIVDLGSVLDNAPHIGIG